jgi:hypothetical protein
VNQLLLTDQRSTAGQKEKAKFEVFEKIIEELKKQNKRILYELQEQKKPGGDATRKEKR